MDWDFAKFLCIVVLVVVVVLVGVVEVIAFVAFYPEVGQEYDVIIVVQAVEKSTTWGDHTNVWAVVYGDQDIHYVLNGFHEFEIGKTYRLVFRNEWWFTYGIFPNPRGTVTLKEIVG